MNPTDLAELKRLRDVWNEQGEVENFARLDRALHDHADALIAAAEECEKLKAVLQEIVRWSDEYGFIEKARAALEGKT